MAVESIIFFHNGGASYLTRVLRQARLANPDKHIFFLGDAASIALARPYAECFPSAKHTAGAGRFLDAYVHLSHIPKEFIRDCITRWFILRDFCRWRGITNFFHADTDLLLFAPVDSVAARMERAFGHYDVALNVPSDPRTTCGHASLWHDLDRLDEFCAMVENIYTLADAATFLKLVALYHQPAASGVPDAGLVSDMSLLNIFRLRTSAHIVDCSAILEGATLDYNIRLPRQNGQHFLMADGMKQLVWHGGAPHGVLQDGGALVRFDALHCQGAAKAHIRNLTPDLVDDGAATAAGITPDREVLVRAAYQVLLERDPDVAGLRHWTNQLAAGLPPQKLLRVFVNSEEFKAHSIYDSARLQSKRDLVVALEALLEQNNRLDWPDIRAAARNEPTASLLRFGSNACRRLGRMLRRR